MNIYIEHDARTVAALGGCDRPACDGIIMKLGDPGHVLAVTIRDNPLRDGWLLDTDLPADRVVTWSGTLAEGLFEPHPLTWMKAGHHALEKFCDELSPQLAAHGKTICFQPHARHVLSDAQSCLRFVRDRADQCFEIAFSPASVIEESMIGEMEDHLIRCFEAIPALEDANAMVVLHDLDSSLGALPLGEGMMPRDLVRTLIKRHVDENTPIVLLPDRIDQQLTWLDSTR